FTTKDEIRNFRDTLSANTRRWWNWFIHCLGNNVLFGIPNTGERAFMCTEHTEEDVEWALEVADNAFAAIGKEARRHKEKAPTVDFLWGHVSASYRRVTESPSFSPTRTQRWMLTSSSGSFGLGRASIAVEVTSYGRTFVPSTRISSRPARPSRTRVATVSRNAGGNA